MSLREHRSSPSTVQFTYSLQAQSSTSLPTVSTIVDLITSLLQSTLCLLFAQWSTIHLDTNRIFGPVLRYLRHLPPSNDIRMIKLTDKSWELTPLGAVSILFLAVFLFFSKSTPIGYSPWIKTNSRGVVLDHPFVGSTNYDTNAISISESLAVYSCLANWWCIVIWGIQGDGSTILSCCCRTWRRKSWSYFPCKIVGIMSWLDRNYCREGRY